MASKRSGETGSANGSQHIDLPVLTQQPGGQESDACHSRVADEGGASAVPSGGLQNGSVSDISASGPSDAETVAPGPFVGEAADSFWTVFAKPLKRAGVSRGLSTDPAAKKYPRAWLMLTAAQTPTGKARKAPGFTLTPTSTGWNVSITDWMISHAYRFEVEFVEDWLPTLERLLANGVNRWVPVEKGELHAKRKTADSKIDKIV